MISVPDSLPSLRPKPRVLLRLLNYKPGDPLARAGDVDQLGLLRPAPFHFQLAFF